ncbi:MAG: DMT family transporter [Marinobacterium sp.]|nr:DMT family transporter [Marinobacterium sp.]
MAYLLLTLTVLFWAGNFVLARALNASFDPITLALYRWSLALLILLPFWLPKAWQARALLARYWARLALLGLIGVGCFNTLLYFGLETTTATNATLLQSAIPVLILLISALFLGETVSPRQWGGVLLSLLGVLLIITQGDPARLLALALNKGDLWVLGAVLAWASYSLLLRLKPAEVSGFVFLGYSIMVAVLALAPLSVWEQGGLPVLEWNSAMLTTVAYMAICPSILSYLFWNRGVAELGAPRAGLFIHLIPLFGLLLSALFLGEKVQAFHLLGIALIFLGIYLAVVSRTLSRITTIKES